MTLGGEAKRAYQREYMRRRRLEARERAARSEAVTLPAVPSDPAEQVAELAKWSKDYLVVPPGHPRSGEPLILPDFAQAFLEEALSARWSLLCCARKNAKSAICAIRVRFAGADKLIYLVGLGEVVARLGRGVPDRFHRAGHTREGITDRDQFTALTLHGFSHAHQRRFDRAKNRSNTRPNSSSLSVRAINLTIQSTNGCFLKRFHRDVPILVTETGGIVNVKVTGVALARK